jgi:cephalosporin-C deacetylase
MIAGGDLRASRLPTQEVVPMRRRFWCVLLLPMIAFAGAAQEPKNAPKKDEPKKDTKILVRCERTEPLFELDEPAAFLLVSNASGELAYRWTDDGITPIKEGKIRVTAGKTYRLDQKAEKPCILRVELEQNGTKIMSVAGVGANKIEPSAAAPADFEEFWRQQRQALADVKIDSDLDYVAPMSSVLLTTYRVTLANIDGRKVQAWMTVPKGPGPYPVVLTLPSSGVFPIEPDLETAALGAITITLSVHDLPPDAPRNVYQAAAEKELKNYWMKGFDDKTKTYFRYAILGGVRMIDYVSARKDFGGQILVTGSRQGGGLAAILAGLDSRVTHLAVDLPAFCDLDARTQHHLEGWPHWLAAASPELKAKVRETAGYYDVCNFTPKFKGKALWRAGLVDEICPARSEFAAYNRLAGAKEMLLTPPVPPSDPRWSAQWTNKRNDFIKSNLTLKLPTNKK